MKRILICMMLAAIPFIALTGTARASDDSPGPSIFSKPRSPLATSVPAGRPRGSCWQRLDWARMRRNRLSPLSKDSIVSIPKAPI